MEKFDKKKSLFTYDGKYTYEYFVDGYKTYPTALFWVQVVRIFLIFLGINTISALLGNSPVRIYFLENFILLLLFIFVRLLAFNKIIRKSSLKELEKIDNKNYNIYFYNDHFIFESEKSIIKNKYGDITKIVESDKYIYIIASNKIFSLKKELITNELYEYIINLNKEVYKRKGKINFNNRHKKKLVDILYVINVFLIFFSLILFQSGIKINPVTYLIEIIPIITLVVGIRFKTNEKLNSKKDISISICCIVFVLVSLILLQFGVHIGPYKLNDIGKKLDYKEFISIDIHDDAEISETSTNNPKIGKEKERNYEIILNIKDKSNIKKSMKDSKNWIKGYLLKSDLYIFIDDFDYNDSSYYLIYNSDNKEYNSVPESTGIYKYYVASYNPNINNGNIEISEFYYQYKK